MSQCLILCQKLFKEQTKMVLSTYLQFPPKTKVLDKILEIINKHKCVYGTYGIHPHEAKTHQNIKSNDIIDKTKQSKKIIGIGETGLDFYYNHSEKKDQINCFEQHIYAAQETDLPIVVHTRSAEKETIEILKKHVKKKNENINSLFHWY